MRSWTPSFRTIAGKSGSPRRAGSPFFKSGRFVPVSVPGGIVFAIAGDSAGNIWMSHQEGLFRLLGARVVERIPWAKLGRKDAATALLHDAAQGGLWLGFRDGGVAYFKDGQLRASYARADGLARACQRASTPIGTVLSGPRPRAG